MRKIRILAVGALGIAAALAVSACSSSPSTAPAASSGASSTPNGAGKTITVWAMNGDLSTATLNAIDAEFTKETGAKVKIETQQWDNITTKVTTALATSTPPDIVDLGNTDVGSFAANGGLLDLTSDQTELEQGQTWLAGLAGPATIDGHLYAVPSFAGDRAVIYNKKIWAADGITAVPTTFAQLETDLNTIKAKNASTSDFSAFYLPGKYWYAGMQWVWDAGGDLVSGSGTSWTGQLDSAASQKGLNDFKTFQNTYSSPASRTVDTDGTGMPDQDKDIFAQLKTSAILGNSWEIGSIEQDNPKITASDLGTFPFPGVSGKNQPVMLGGSDWGIAAKSQNQALAIEWTKIAASPEIQNDYVFGKDGWIPNSQQSVTSATAKVGVLQKAFFTAALNTKSTPAAANWATIEGDGTIGQFFSDVVSGAKSVSDAANGFDSHLQSVLNG